jgi:hypothetical protein
LIQVRHMVLCGLKNDQIQIIDQQAV